VSERDMDDVELGVRISVRLYWHEPAKNRDQKILREQAEVKINGLAKHFEKGLAVTLKDIGSLQP